MARYERAGEADKFLGYGQAVFASFIYLFMVLPAIVATRPEDVGEPTKGSCAKEVGSRLKAAGFAPPMNQVQFTKDLKTGTFTAVFTNSAGGMTRYECQKSQWTRIPASAASAASAGSGPTP